MKKTFKWIAITSILLFSPFQTFGQQNQEERAEVKILQERIQRNDEKTTIRLEALEKNIKLQLNALETRMNLYVGFAVAIFIILTFLGYRTIVIWIKQNIESRTDEEVKKYQDILVEKGQSATDRMLADLTDKAKATLAELDNRKIEYENALDELKSRSIEIGKPLPPSAHKPLGDFTEKLTQLKAEGQYTSIDWFFSGLAKLHSEDYNGGIQAINNAIEKDPEYYPGNLALGFAYFNLGQYERALENYNKAIELMGKHPIEWPLGDNDFAEVKILAHDYEGALDTIKSAKPLASKEIEKRAIRVHLDCIARRLLDMDTSACEEELKELTRKDFTTAWTTDEIESWVKKADIPENKKRFILEKIEVIKQHQKGK